MRPAASALARALLLFAGWLLVGLLVFRGLVFEPGVVADGDLGSPLEERLTLAYHAAAWNPWAQGFSVHPPKLVLIAPMTALTLLGAPDETVAKLYLPVILAIAGTAGSLTLLAILRDRPAPARWAGALVGGAALALDPWALARLTAHYWLVLGYALWPATIWLYWRALEGDARPWRLAALGALLAVQGVQLHLVFQTALLMAFVGVYHVATAPARDWRRFLRVTSLVVLVFLGLSAAWLVPFAAAAASIGTAPSYAVTEEVVSLLSRNQYPSWVVAGYGGFVPDVAYGNGPGVTTMWLAAGLLLAALAVAAALAHRRDRFVAMLLLLTVLGLLAALGSFTAHPEAYHALVFSSSVGWIFRDPSKLTAIPRMGLALLLGMGVAYAVQAVRARLAGPLPRAQVASVSPVLLVVGALLVANWPATTGDLNGALVVGDVPDDYDDLLAYLEAAGPDRRALFLQYTTLAFAWNPGSDSAKDIVAISTRSPVFPRSGTSSEFVDHAFLRELPPGLHGNLSAYLAAAGISDVVVHLDVLPDVSRAAEYLAVLDAEPGIARAWSSESFVAYRVEGAVPAFRVVGATASLFGSHDDLARLLGAGALDGERHAIHLGEGLPRRPDVPYDVSFVRSAPLPDFLPLGPPSAVVVRPFDASTRHQPALAWSKEATSNPLHAEWRASESRWGERMTMTDLGVGLVVADAPGLTLDVPARVEAGRAYDVYVRALGHPIGDAVTVRVEEENWTLRLHAETVGLRTWHVGRWTPSDADARFIIENVAGRNAVSAITLVPADDAPGVFARLQGMLRGDATVAFLHPEAWTRDGETWTAQVVSPSPISRVEVHYASGDDVWLEARSVRANGPASNETARLVLEVTAGAAEPLALRFHGDAPPAILLASDRALPAPPPAKRVEVRDASATRYELVLPPTEPGDALVATEFYDAQWRLAGAAGPHAPALGFQNAFHGLPAEGGVLTLQYRGQTWLLVGSAISIATLAVAAWLALRDARRPQEAAA